jgi:hypothetical protein
MSKTNEEGNNLGCLGLVWLASVFFLLGWLTRSWIQRELTGVTPQTYWEGTYWEEWLFFLGLVFAPVLYMYLKSKWKK